MKKIYSSPEIEIKAFATEDIITASGMDTQANTADVSTENISLTIDVSELS